MLDFSDIEINKYQLNELLSAREKISFKYLIKNSIYCPTCKKDCKISILGLKVYLDRFNDIKIVAKCQDCGTEVSHIIAFGENESFFRKAVQFRNTIHILAEAE